MNYRSSAFYNTLIKLNILDIIKLLMGKLIIIDGIGTAIGFWKWPGLYDYKKTTWFKPRQ